MQTVRLLSRTNADGILRIDVPTDLHDIDVEVVVIMHPVAVRQTATLPNLVEQTECNLLNLLERCESDTARLLGRGAANRLANWRQYQGDELIAFIKRVLRGEHRQNGWELDRQGGLSLERIVIDHCPGLFTQDDIREAKATLGITD